MRINEIIESIQHISLTESVSRALNEHLNRQVPLCDSIFRYQSDSYFETFRLAKQRRADGNLPDLDWESEELLRTDIGESVNLKGIGQVWLDAPYLDEGCDLLEQFVNGDQDIDEETYEGNDFFEQYGVMWFNEDDELDEAEYQGRKVPLGKPMRGDVKKFKVYVKDPTTGNTKKVNFGDPNMKIKKSNPVRRRSFRARHNCDNPGPRTKARYWSCRKW